MKTRLSTEKSLGIGSGSLPLGGLPKGLALLLVDLGHALPSHSPGLGIGHAKHIICLDSAVAATVAWDWLTELLHLLRWVLGLDTVKCTLCIHGILLLLFVHAQCAQVSCILLLSTNACVFLILNIVGKISSEESMNLAWRNWL